MGAKHLEGIPEDYLRPHRDWTPSQDTKEKAIPMTIDLRDQCLDFRVVNVPRADYR